MNSDRSFFIRKVFFQTWGCQMNVADSERMQSLLKHRSYALVQKPDQADVIVLNTCHIREKSTHKALSQLGWLKRLKTENPHVILVVAGCVAQLEPKKLKTSCPQIDLLIGPDQIEKLPDILENFYALKKDASQPAFQVHNCWDSDPNYEIPIDVIPPWKVEDPSQKVTRFVNIIKGCNNFCTFCIIPFTRGREKSRSLEQILQESQWHVDQGTKEIVLLGQNVNSYGLTGDSRLCESNGWTPFTWLLLQVSQIPGLKWVRFTTSNPHDFTDHIPRAFKKEKKLANSFHLPVQAGSDRILNLMKRKYTRDLYLEKVHQLRRVRPHLALTTDIIVGFPGETDEEFQETLDLIKEVRYASLFAFKYSSRRGTGAARFPDQIPEEVKSMRLAELFFQQKKITREYHESFLNQEMEVLIQYPDAKHSGYWYGRNYEGRLVKVTDLPSQFSPAGESVMVYVEQVNETALQGRFQGHLSSHMGKKVQEIVL